MQRVMRKTVTLFRHLIYEVVTLLRRLFRFQLERNFRSMEIAIVIPLSDEAQNYLVRLQLDILKRFGVNDGLTAHPHITLKLGFRVSDVEPFAQYIEEIAKTTSPFSVTLANFGDFDQRILFQHVQEDFRLDQLRRRIVGDLSEKFGVVPNRLEGDEFKFHVTLAYGMKRSQFLAAKAELSKLKPTRSFRAESLELLCHTGVHWFTYRRSTITAA
jgi:2'-5' RNA ligase